jgi:NFACT protein RNA binding domain
MEIGIDYTKSAQENAQDYFEKAKDAKKKLEGAKQAVARLEEKVRQLEKSKVIEKKIRKKEEREWYEKFYWFFASNGMLAIGGRSAQQNEEAVSKYLGPNDLFFHANIFGASAVVLKEGKSAGKEVKEEAAQFAACFSKAWENNQSSVDVFAVGREQISKSSQAGSLGTGSFLISGEREWFKNVKLELWAFSAEPASKETQQADAPAILADAGKFNVVPGIAYPRLGPVKGIRLTPGKARKSEAAAKLSKKLNYPNIDYIMQHLPPGEFHLQ